MPSLRHMLANVDYINKREGDVKKSHIFKNQILILLMARSSLIFCIFKVKNAVKNARITLLWMAEMSVVYHRLGWACSLRIDFH